QQAAPAAQTSQPVEISPVARRAAQELGVDLNELGAKIGDRRITREDVEQAASSRSAAPVLPSVKGDTRLPISRVRKITAERMSASSQTTAPVTLTTEADATELVKLRKQLKGASAGRAVPSYNDLLAKLCSVALEEQPMLNARFEGDEIVMSAGVHIGLAVDTERGLLVPVINDVQAKSLRQIAGESAALIENARGGSLKADAMRGSTFTISNLGMYEIDAFTPIINLPECAILGVGRIVPKVVVIDAENERTAIRHMMFLSLTFDHRLVDGAPSARFLQRIKQLIEQPYLWLVG
ncbi:MAG: 2-oxo acid dehydrogenase subunit E2, partial [Burkholderiales bacterium]|nr:2-oxo acid dehydrogenase subunit E2 [Anaerolineae bacterium]